MPRSRRLLYVLLAVLTVIVVVLVGIYFYLSWPITPSFPVDQPPSQKAIFFLKDRQRKPVPFGVRLKESIENGDDRTRFVLSGVLLEKPRWKTCGRKSSSHFDIRID